MPWNSTRGGGSRNRSAVIAAKILGLTLSPVLIRVFTSVWAICKKGRLVLFLLPGSYFFCSLLAPGVY